MGLDSSFVATSIFARDLGKQEKSRLWSQSPLIQAMQPFRYFIDIVENILRKKKIINRAHNTWVHSTFHLR